MSLGRWRLGGTAIGAALCLSACLHQPGRAAPRELFAAVRVGMTRVRVEKLLGPPTVRSASPERGTWYLPPPLIEPYESPFAPGTIGITYSRDGRVETKVLNPQLKD